MSRKSKSGPILDTQKLVHKWIMSRKETHDSDHVERIMESTPLSLRENYSCLGAHMQRDADAPSLSMFTKSGQAQERMKHEQLSCTLPVRVHYHGMHVCMYMYVCIYVYVYM